MSSAPQNYPIIHFAAVMDVQYASTNDRDPTPYFARGGVMLSELVSEEFAMVITGHSYSVTIVAVAVTATWKIISDNVCLEVRLSPWGPGEQLHGQTWLYIRFKRSKVYADFNRVLRDIFSRVQSKAQLFKTRLDDIAYARTSNFTKYCRQYLGEDYFDQLTDSGEDETDDEDTPSDGTDSQREEIDEPSSGGSDTETTAVEGLQIV